MVGLGETDEEIARRARGPAGAGVDIVTLGQYLRPTRDHAPVARYVTPEGFGRLEGEARALGFPPCTPGSSCARRSTPKRSPRRGGPTLSGWRREGLAALSGILLVLSFPKFGHGRWPGSRCPAARRAAGPAGLARRAPRLRDRRRLRPRPRCTGRPSWSSSSAAWPARRHRRHGGALPRGRGVPGALRLGGRRAGRRLRAGRAPFAPFAWVATEFSRAYTFFRFPWCLLGYSQHADTALHPDRASRRSTGSPSSSCSARPCWRTRAVEPRPAAPARALASVALLVGAAWGSGRGDEPARRRRSGASGRPRPGQHPAGREVGPGERRRTSDRHVDLTSRRPTRARASWSGPSPPCPTTSTENPALAALLRDAGAASGGSTCSSATTTSTTRPQACRASRWGPSCSTRRRRSPSATTRSASCPSASTCPLQPLLTLGGRFAAKLGAAGRRLHARDGGLHRGRSTATGSAPSSATRPSSRTWSASSPPAARSSWSTSRTTPGTARPRRPTSTSPWPPSAPSRTATTWSAPPTPASPRSSTRGAGSSSAPALFDTHGRGARRAARRRDDVLRPPRRRLRLGLRRDAPWRCLVGRDVCGPSAAARRRRMERAFGGHPLNADLRQRFEPLGARAADIRGYL